jgi:hypothetical protein
MIVERQEMSMIFAGFNRLFFIYPPSQKATGVNPWMNAKRVTLRSLGEGGYASAGFAEVCEDATAVKPWSFTIIKAFWAFLKILDRYRIFP